MREGYIEPASRKKILLLADDLRFPSGVGTMSKEIVFGTCHRYNWVQIGAGINHPDRGKIIVMNDAVTKETGVEDPDVKIYPSNGYGDSQTLRDVIKAENPDAIMIFTDPRYWIWLFNMERELRSKMPIMYLNIWDNPPYPMYNKSYYRSCDGLFGISKQTVNINRQVLGDDAVNHIIRYLPHGVSAYYKPLGKNDPAVVEMKKKIFGDNGPEFILFYNARNISRKRTSDIILAWNNLCTRYLNAEQASKCCLYLHTDPVDDAGTDLLAVANTLCDLSRTPIRFDPNRYSTEDLNLLYNMSDGVIMASAAEGWGLAVTEALNTGKMFIATVTGGMQDQMRFEDENGNWINFSKTFPSNHTGIYKKHGSWCIPIWPDKGRSLVGSPLTPYIYDDRTSIEDITKAMYELWLMPEEDREKNGMEGYKWATSDEAGFTSAQMAQKFIEAADATFEFYKSHPRSRYELIKIETKRPSNYVDYDPVNYKVEVDEKDIMRS